MLSISIAVTVVGYLIFGLAGSLWVLFAARLLQGLGTANIGTAQAILVPETRHEAAPPRRWPHR